MLNNMPLKQAITIPFTLLAFLIIGSLGYLSYRNSEIAVNDLAKQLETEVAQRIHEHLSHFLKRPLELNQVVADAVSLSMLDVENLDNLSVFFWKQLQLFEVGNISFAKPNGEFIAVSRFKHDKPIIQEISHRHGINKIYHYQGNLQGERLGLLDVRDSFQPLKGAWYQDAVKQQRYVRNSVFQWADMPDIISLPTSRPVYSKTGELLGVIAVDLLLSEITTFLQNLTISQSGQAFIIERNGLLIANSHDEKPYIINAAEAHRLKSSDSTDPITQQISVSLQQAYPNFAQFKEEQQLELPLMGEDYYVRVTPWFDEYGLDWLVVVAIPKRDFMARIYANNRFTLLLGVFALFITLIISSLLAAWIVTPIHNLNHAAQQLAHGEWQVTLPVERCDEIGQLAVTFSDMSGQIKNMMDNLEENVQRRTAQLAQANSEIKVLNKQLQADNTRMSAELDITRQLQKMVLPKEHELEAIQELDIAGYMQPADEVGGDYYDVLQRDGHVKISIGDVTGHGLESGVLMMMVQTAVRTLLDSGINDSKTFLSILNETIYNNVHRMGSDKNLTLALLDYFDSKVHLSGQHEEVLVVRSDGVVERVDTIELGFMVGIEPDITGFIQQYEIGLQQGDGMVLYTDGITEALNQHNQLYGIERLCEVVSQHWQNSASAIQQAVIEDVKNYAGARIAIDDQTLLILKKR